MFTIGLATGCISFLVHALLPAVLLPVRQRGRGAHVFGGGGAGHTLDCRVWQRERRQASNQNKVLRYTFTKYI